MSNARRIVLLGKTGAGKSSLANTILGEEVFKVDHGFKSETKRCQAKTRCVNGRSITLIDTPGFFDTDRPEEEVKDEILRCIIECAPGPHAFLIVLEVKKYTKQEQEVIDKIKENFSEEILEYATVVFTHGDQLPEGQKIEDNVHDNELLSDLIRKCGGRCHVIDNKYWKENPQDEYRSNRFQVQELLNTIEKIVMENNGNYYTNEMLLAVEEETQLEEDNIRLLPGNMTEEEIREQAKGSVFKKLRIKLAGTGTGALLGALCGLAVPIGVVVLALKGVGVSLIDVTKMAAAAVKQLGAKTAAGGAAAAAVGAAAGGGAAAVGGGAGGGAAAVGGGAAVAAGVAEGAAVGGAAAAAGVAEGAAAAGGTAAVTGAAEGAAAAGGLTAAGTAVSNERRIVLLGKTGAGKSSLANTIFREQVFNIGHSANSETKTCEEETRCFNGRNITLIDTPGFFDTDSKSVETMKPEIVRCITESAPGLHAFLIVLKVERFTVHEQDIVKNIQQYFSEEVFKYATVVFTHGDQLQEGQKIDDFFLQNKPLRDLVRKCGGRCHVIDNKYWKENQEDDHRSNRFQVKELLNTIEATVMENNGIFFTNDMLQTVEEEIQQEEEKIRLLPEIMTDKEIREQAKVGVFKKLLIKLAGVGTGALLGALFGIVSMVVVVVKVLNGMEPLNAVVLKTTAAVGASAGAVVGGLIGYQAAEGAGTPKEASKRAAEAVCKGALSAVKIARDVYSEISQQKLKHSSL